MPPSCAGPAFPAPRDSCLKAAALLKPLPYSHPESLVSVMHTAPGINVKDLPVSPSCYFIYREQGRTFEDIALWTGDRVSITPTKIEGAAA